MHNLITKLLRMSFVFVNFPSLMIQKTLLGSTKNINFWRFTCSSLTSPEISKLFNSPHHFQIAPLVNSSQHFVKKLTLSGRISKVMWPWFYIDMEITIQYFVLIQFYLNRLSDNDRFDVNFILHKIVTGRNFTNISGGYMRVSGNIG